MTTLITGANRGIGAGLRQAYLRRGGRVIGTSRSAVNGLEELDVTDPASVRALADRLSGEAISLLICNAGVYPGKGDALETGFGKPIWDETLTTNVTGVFLTIQAFLPHLRRAEDGKIAIISSRLGSSMHASGGNYAYRASKAAVVNLGKNLAADLKEDGIAVGLYHPGWVATDMGGAGADISVDESVDGLVERFDELSLMTSGTFTAFDGTRLDA